MLEFVIYEESTGIFYIFFTAKSCADFLKEKNLPHIWARFKETEQHPCYVKFELDVCSKLWSEKIPYFQKHKDKALKQKQYDK